MAPTEHELVARIYCGNGYYASGNTCYAYSPWYYWGRWVFAAVVVIFVIALLLGLGCINSRRRRRQGLSPRYGTGWMSRPGKFGGGGYQNNPNGYNYGNYGPPPPQYQQNPVQGQYTGTTFNPNDGYYGNNRDIPLQHPEHSYQRGTGGDPVYQPPAGPPPSKVA